MQEGERLVIVALRPRQIRLSSIASWLHLKTSVVVKENRCGCYFLPVMLSHLEALLLNIFEEDLASCWQFFAHGAADLAGERLHFFEGHETGTVQTNVV